MCLVSIYPLSTSHPLQHHTLSLWHFHIILNQPAAITHTNVVTLSCGSSPGNSPKHIAAATALATEMHRRGMHLVYGGGTYGIMGQVASTLVKLSGPESVHGIIPRALIRYEQAESPEEMKKLREAGNNNNDDDNDRDSGHGTPESPKQASTSANPRAGTAEYTAKFGLITEVSDMHTRKRMMADKVIAGGPGSGFVALSGGYGTFEELMEVTTWNQLGIHSRGVAVYNVEGYWDGLKAWIDGAVGHGFVPDGCRNIIVFGDDAVSVVDHLENYQNATSRLQLNWDTEGKV